MTPCTYIRSALPMRDITFFATTEMPDPSYGSMEEIEAIIKGESTHGSFEDS